MATVTSYHCPHCGARYAPMLVIQWDKRVKCGQYASPFQVSHGAFCNNCGLVFATYSFLPFWMLSTVLLYVIPLPDPEGIGFWGRLGLGAIGGVVLACFALGAGLLFGSLAESYRQEPK